MRRKSRSDYIPVSKVDVVVVVGIRENFCFKAEVLAVEERYSGWHSNVDNKKDAPLLTIKNLFTGEIKKYDNGYVQAIIKKAQSIRSMPTNIFREHWGHPRIKAAIKTDKRGVAFGPLTELARVALSNLPYHLPLDVNPNKLFELYNKQRAGLISREKFGFYSVRWKSFSKWVQGNAYRITLTLLDKFKEDKKIHQMLEDSSESFTFHV